MEPQELLEEITTFNWEALTPYLMTLMVAILAIIAAQILANFVERIIRQYRSAHTAVLANKVIFYTLFLGIGLTALSYLGVNLTGLIAAAGILTVAVAFAAQTSVSNVISGLFLYFDRPFSIGDTVKVDTVVGTVVSIDLLSSRVRTFDNLMVRLPNETLLKSTITNFSLFAIRRIDIPISVAYGTDIKICRNVLQEAMQRHPSILDEPAPVVLLESLGADGVDLTVRAWIERTEFVRARSELILTLYNALNEAKIEIPRPQRVVHLRGYSSESGPVIPFEDH